MGDRPPGLGGKGTGRGPQGIRAALGCWGAGREGGELFRGGMCQVEHGPSEPCGVLGPEEAGETKAHPWGTKHPRCKPSLLLPPKSASTL